LKTLSLNLNSKAKSGSEGNEVVASEVVGVGDDVLVVSINEAISLLAGDEFSRFRNLLVKSEETEELCVGSLVFGVSITGAP
ncbi:hypothetical protein Tco_1287541, partial [Tanacetum coccineum]